MSSNGFGLASSNLVYVVTALFLLYGSTFSFLPFRSCYRVLFSWCYIIHRHPSSVSTSHSSILGK
ncbi:hypothetical protein BU26DRAFT_517221 [Trematosphaeria pertusa]|uniref:Uncharacterized protein n=1 Tax=Trematosphaeria pertusa TaxID=390896 RepID=A0A6A6ISQ2_9PLEO|nr:uncharacterized protein BU26DRAFT_517221 [Trematosphaeria pertusa]KAF2252630.1 hypothetical protein BU26DRAFT_517221 [Trematosphaeria pertusa]